MTYKEDFTFFWDGPFSQWEPSKFTIKGVEYVTAEQYMMHQKAIFFNDKRIAKRIMETKSPREQKRLGRLVSNFNPTLWDDVAYDIVLTGNIAKFSQNPHLLKHLMDTEGTELVEASPYDTIWGIGLDENNPDAWDKTKWKGRNLLGKVLDETRKHLIEKLKNTLELND